MKNPYEILGVEPTATQAHIRSAYRKRAKTAHPDQGGSAEAWDDLQKAYEILSDDARRARYDESGKWDDQEALRRFVRVGNVLNQHFSGAISNSGGYIEQEDLVRMMRLSIQESIRTANLTVGVHQKNLANTSKIKQRLKFKGKGRNPILEALEETERAAHGQIAYIKEEIGVMTEALELAKSYQYDTDQEPKDRLMLGNRPNSWRQDINPFFRFDL